jgi:N-acetylmuramoyl-L-alanine amidase
MLRLARYLLMEGATVHVIIQDPVDGIRDDKFLKNNKKKIMDLHEKYPDKEFLRIKSRRQVNKLLKR